MYSGTTFRKNSGGFVGVHQKIDRVAHKHVAPIIGGSSFPSIRQILHFEGNNGPDGIKRKSPAVDEPWHYVDPTNPDDTELLTHIAQHSHNLTDALRRGNTHRAAFEAAWMAHAITDGLTPAHHYPLSDKIEELWGKPKEERLTILDKNFIRGATRRDTMSKNWEYWGAKGVFSTHLLFELGVASAIKTHRYTRPIVTESDIAALHELGFEAYLRRAIHDVYHLNMYEQFWRRGWSNKLARVTRRELIPTIVRCVALGWLDASERASA